jgi:hypothetical protein
MEEACRNGACDSRQVKHVQVRQHGEVGEEVWELPIEVGQPADVPVLESTPRPTHSGGESSGDSSSESCQQGALTPMCPDDTGEDS